MENFYIRKGGDNKAINKRKERIKAGEENWEGCLSGVYRADGLFFLQMERVPVKDSLTGA